MPVPTPHCARWSTRWRAMEPAEAEISGAPDRPPTRLPPPMADIADWLEQSYLPGAPEQDGVGRERYAAASRYFLGMEVDLEETYEWGWSEIERIRADMRALADQIKPGATRREVVELLNTDPDRRASRDDFVRIMQERQDIALGELDGSHFDVPDPIKGGRDQAGAARNVHRGLLHQPE